MNICHDLISIFKGNCIHLASDILDGKDKFVLSSTQWRMIDKEMDSIKNGTSASVFPDVPRNCKYGAHWKAAECLEFITNYALIVFEGRLPKKYMKNIHSLSVIVELCRRPALSEIDVERLKELGVEFVRGYEDLYYRKNPRRVGVCKSTIHSMVHLGWAVEQCGPPIYYSQFWVERYIGDIKSRLHATNLAAESLNENAKSAIRVNLFYGNHFASKKDDLFDMEMEISQSANQEVVLLAPWDKESLEDGYHIRKNTRDLLIKLVQKSEEVDAEEAGRAIEEDEIWSFGRMKISCGDGIQVIGARDARRHRKKMVRSDFYVAAEFQNSVHTDGRDVYYGRILKILRYNFRCLSEEKTKELVLVEWSRKLRADSFGQVYCGRELNQSFTNATIEDASIILNGIGIVEHCSPSFRGTRTYFVDPSRSSRQLLSPERVGVDGVNRNLESR